MRFKWYFIAIPIVAVLITFFLVKKMAKQYISEVQISTGLLDPSKKVVSNETVDFFAVNQQFANIIEKFSRKRMINILTYNLMIHDLSDPKKSFRDHADPLKKLNDSDKTKIVSILQSKLATKALLTLDDNKGTYKLYDLAESMGYGEETLRKKLDISHANNSDLITVGFISENPNLSAYVVNTLSNEFLNIYSLDVSTNQSNSAMLLDSLLKSKELVMNRKNESLSTFKRTKGVLNLNEQSATVYNEISKYESQRADMLRTIVSNQGAINTIVGKLRGSDAYVNGSSRADNREIVNLKRQLQAANNAFIDGGFKPSDQRKIDSLNKLITIKSDINADENVLDPRTSKQSLVQQKLDLEIALQQAKSGIKSIDTELSTLRGRYAGMVPFDADIQNYERDADIATKDYMAALDRYNQSKTSQSLGLHLKIEQAGLPGNPQPSKKVLYVAGAGFVSIALCLGALFLLVLLDETIKDADRLRKLTKSNVIASVCKINTNERNPSVIWKENGGDLALEQYRNDIRSCRFELLKQLDHDDDQILGITSLEPNDGKTQLAYSLAYSFAMVGRKTLLIADNLPLVETNSKQISVNQSFQNFIVKRKLQTEDLITVMTKNAAKNSLLESQSFHNLKSGFEILKNEFDNIIIDINSLQDLNLAKEWLLFTDKSITVFKSGNKISSDQHKLVEYIQQQENFAGWVFNQTSTAT
ncbi:lipopolysaccharide biosynthesis protein [Pedobacter frigidisoli]|uniref:Lipopolysaccharide biosynthesis protein n=2 Tax=Pedobacter frigidisoli TaxID=2530455 RepID=A0A4R0NMD9_9SPHI|nr:lipopolysaccharide biosynthesis protein [Pedobacter frigidisoli]